MGSRGKKILELLRNNPQNETVFPVVEADNNEMLGCLEYPLEESNLQIGLASTYSIASNVIIECPADVAKELVIKVDENVPVAYQVPSSLQSIKNHTFLQETSHAPLDFDDDQSSSSADEALDKLYKPSENSNSPSDSSSSQESTANENRNSNHETEILLSHTIANEESIPKRKRSLKGQTDASLWKKNINISKRRKGEEYQGRKLSEGKTISIVKKKRELGQACTSHSCVRTQSRHCNKFTHEDRLAIFKNLWENLDWGQRKVFVSGLTDVCPPKSRRKSNTEHLKISYTLMYNLRKGHERLGVCKIMFLHTMGIGEWTARNWALKGLHNSLNSSKCNVPMKPEQNKHLESFLNALPKMPSHYCRSQSSKLYLESIFKSKKEVYHVYVENCTEAKKTPLSLTQFKKIYAQMNIGLFQPKKDQCDLCCMHEVNNLSEEKWLKHQQKKEDARTEMKADTDKAKLDKSIVVITMDLQSVLLCPLLKASAIYYKKKLIVHNFTMFNNVTHEVTCYVWHEGEGNVTANEFCSCIVDYIDKNCNEQIKEIILWSDGCTYQNRNSILANALLQCAALKNVCIIQKILEKGHTQMSCDSVHSVIERKIKNRTISVPADYVNIIETARKNPIPYDVIYIDHTFFRTYSNLKYYGSIRPGKKAGDPVVTDLRALKYNGSDLTIDYKFKMADKWQCIPQRPGKYSAEKPIGLYSTAPGIQKDKYDHLQELTKVLKVDYHLFYKNLKYY